MMDVWFKDKRLGDRMGIERDKILLGVHLLSFCKVSIIEEMWLDIFVRNIPH